jgi:hypothetical protein
LNLDVPTVFLDRKWQVLAVEQHIGPSLANQSQRKSSDAQVTLIRMPGLFGYSQHPTPANCALLLLQSRVSPTLFFMSQ